jgi:ABC-type lipoprotein release transport system permease subunit
MGMTLRLAWRNLWRHPRRTWLTTSAMVFSNVLLIFLISLQFGMYGMMIDNTLSLMTGHLQIQAPGYREAQKMRQVVPDAGGLAETLRAELGTARVAARASAFALASSEDRTQGVQLLGVEPDFEPRVSTLPGLVREGRYLDDLQGQEIVVGRVLARNLRVGVGDELTILGSGRDGSFAAAILVVVGIFDSGVSDLDRAIAMMPLGAFQEAFAMQGAGHQVVISGAQLADVPALKAEVEARLPPGADLVVHDWDTLQAGLRQMIQADISSAFFMYAVLVVLVAFSVLNTQLMSVLERTREFGIVLALGLRPGRLGRLVLLETVLMGLLGAVLGVLAGIAVTAWFSKHGLSYPGLEELAASFNLPGRMYPRLTPWSVLTGPLVVFGFTLLASVYPALRLRRLEPVEAMRAA